VRTVVVIRVERAAPLISPAYESGRSEREIREQWMHYFDAVNRSKRLSAAAGTDIDQAQASGPSGG
jgi:hypothetical protein